MNLRPQQNVGIEGKAVNFLLSVKMKMKSSSSEKYAQLTSYKIIKNKNDTR